MSNTNRPASPGKWGYGPIAPNLTRETETETERERERASEGGGEGEI